MRDLVVLAFSFAICTWASAAELQPFLKNKRVGVVVHNLTFPETLSKDLTSGLTNKILIRTVVNASSRAVVSRIIEVSIKFDLWEETFKVSVTIDDKVQSVKPFTSAEVLRHFLTHIHLPDLFELNQLTNQQNLVLQADVLLNPVAKERMEKIRNWVTQNSTSTPVDPTGMGSARTIGPVKSNTLFNKIFAQYAGGSDFASVWRESVISKPFATEGLESGK